MKKIIAIIASVALAVTAIALTSSCQKDINNAKSLIGTLWICQDQVEGSRPLEVQRDPHVKPPVQRLDLRQHEQPGRQLHRSHSRRCMDWS